MFVTKPLKKMYHIYVKFFALTNTQQARVGAQTMSEVVKAY